MMREIRAYKVPMRWHRLMEQLCQRRASCRHPRRSTLVYVPDNRYLGTWSGVLAMNNDCAEDATVAYIEVSETRTPIEVSRNCKISLNFRTDAGLLTLHSTFRQASRTADVDPPCCRLVRYLSTSLRNCCMSSTEELVRCDSALMVA